MLSDENLKTISKLSETVPGLAGLQWWAKGDVTVVEALMNAVRQEERARAVEVVKPFADYLAAADPDGMWTDDSELGQVIVPGGLRISIRYSHLRRAAAYISDTDQFAENAKCSDNGGGRRCRSKGLSPRPATNSKPF